MAGKKFGVKMERYATLRTPKGIAGFSYLREPDEKFGAKHRIQLFIDKDDPETKTFIKALMDTQADYFKKIGVTAKDKSIPGLKKADAYLAEKFGKHGIKEGSLYFEFSSNARKDDVTDEWKFIPIVDVKGQPSSDLRVFSGDIVRVSTTLMGYNTGKEKGIKAYLNAVQMLVKKSGSGSAANVFEDESAEYETAEEAQTEEAPFGDESGTTPEEAPAPKAETKKTKGKTTPAPKAETNEIEEGSVDIADLL